MLDGFVVEARTERVVKITARPPLCAMDTIVAGEDLL